MKKTVMNVNDLEYALKNSENIEVNENDEVVAEFIVKAVGLKIENGKVIENGRVKK